ncbi:MAG: hypothetical protein IPM51_11590 [Sphingobacteriaceae bacterium]|nr:hypothetical protein [Sphingobacteriaceae bacterium]
MPDIPKQTKPFERYKGGEYFVKKEDLNGFDARLRALERQHDLGQASIFNEGLILVKFAERVYSNDLKWYLAHPLILDTNGSSAETFPTPFTSPQYGNNIQIPCYDYKEHTDYDMWVRNPLYFSVAQNERAWVAYCPRYWGFYLINPQCPGVDEETDPDPNPPE